jgi:hypothetical protein
MWTTVSLLAALTLSPAQASELNLTNIRSTYGFLGPSREDNKLLPGDALFVAFDIENIKVDDGGRVLYGMAMEVLDSKGKAQFKQDPRDLEAVNSLGGSRLPAFAHVETGFDQPPGDYTLKLTVTDRTAKTSKSFERKFVLAPGTFGLIRFRLSSDPEGQLPVPPLAVAGQSIWLNFVAVGFARGSNNQPNLAVEMRIVDDKDQPTLAKPFTGDVTKNVEKEVLGIPMQFLLTLNRPGKFAVKLKATDQVSKKTAELAFPITVLESK